MLQCCIEILGHLTSLNPMTMDRAKLFHPKFLIGKAHKPTLDRDCARVQSRTGPPLPAQSLCLCSPWGKNLPAVKLSFRTIFHFFCKCFPTEHRQIYFLPDLPFGLYYYPHQFAYSTTSAAYWLPLQTHKHRKRRSRRPLPHYDDHHLKSPSPYRTTPHRSLHGSLFFQLEIEPRTAWRNAGGREMRGWSVKCPVEETPVCVAG